MIIDPPSAFATIDEWRAFLADMGAHDEPEAKEWMTYARNKVAELSPDHK